MQLTVSVKIEFGRQSTKWPRSSLIKRSQANFSTLFYNEPKSYLHTRVFQGGAWSKAKRKSEASNIFRFKRNAFKKCKILSRFVS